MRITFRHQYDRYLNDLGRAEQNMFRAQNQVTTGKRIQTVGDDPFGSATSLTLRGIRDAVDQYDKNLTSAKGALAITESALDEMTKLLRRANEIAVAGANSSTSQEGRNAMAKEVESIQQRLLDLGNTKGPQNQFLFAGQRNDQKPFTAAGATITYHGDDLSILVEVSANETMASNIQGRQNFTKAWDDLESLKANLLGGNLPALSGVNLPAIQASERDFQAARGEVGSRLKTIEGFNSQNVRRKDELTAQISDVEDVDLSEAILNYKQAETAYQAALQSISVSSRLSLMDFLR